MTIKIFVTGGTFDKEYDEIKGLLFFNKTHISEVLKIGRCKLKVEIIVEVSSDEYETIDSIIDEFSQECDYEFKSTDNVEVHNTEFRDCYLT